MKSSFFEREREREWSGRCNVGIFSLMCVFFSRNILIARSLNNQVSYILTWFAILNCTKPAAQNTFYYVPPHLPKRNKINQYNKWLHCDMLLLDLDCFVRQNTIQMHCTAWLPFTHKVNLKLSSDNRQTNVCEWALKNSDLTLHSSFSRAIVSSCANATEFSAIWQTLRCVSAAVWPCHLATLRYEVLGWQQMNMAYLQRSQHNKYKQT